MEFTTQNIDDFLNNAIKLLLDNSTKNISARRKGKCVDCQQYELAQHLITSMRGFVPEGTVISGTQASDSFTIPSFVGTKTFTLQVTSGEYYAEYSVSITGTPAIIAATIANDVNSMYPAPYSYVASVDDDEVTITGSNYDEDNDTVFSVLISGDIMTETITLAGGVAAEYQNNNCITDEEAEEIIDKIAVILVPSGRFPESFCSGIGCMVVEDDFIVS